MTSTAPRKLNLPLSPELHEALFAESRRAGVPATRLVRSALEEWLEQRRRARVRDEVRRFALASAGTELDFDVELEGAAAEQLRAFDEDVDAPR
jgi:hypothetical protein